MAELNEEIVRRYFELQGWFVRTNVRYTFVKGGDSDLDLVMFHPLTGMGAVVEVKGWHTENITAGHLAAWPSLFNFTGPAARKAAMQLLGSAPYQQVLVVGRLGIVQPGRAGLCPGTRRADTGVPNDHHLLDRCVGSAQERRQRLRTHDPAAQDLRISPGHLKDTVWQSRGSGSHRQVASARQ